MNAQKTDEHEAEIEKIKNVFLAILRDIKNDIDSGVFLLSQIRETELRNRSGNRSLNRSSE